MMGKKMNYRLTMCVLALFVASVAYGDTLKKIFLRQFAGSINGKSQSFSKDDRHDTHNLSSAIGPGPKTGCVGSTYNINITLSNPVVLTTEGSMDSAYSVTAKANYSGLHVNNIWVDPCIQNDQVSTNVSGSITFTLKRSGPFAQTLLQVGEVSNASTAYTSEVVQTALKGALGLP